MSKEKDTAPIRVFGLSRFETETLRQIALKKYGKASVSLLAKKTLQAMLESPTPPEKPNHAQHPAANRRITVRLPAADRSYLLRLAEVRKGTVNDAVRDIVHMYVGRHPGPSDNEIAALYQSNVQLSAIGRNLNQIARHLNAGESASLSSRHFKELEGIIFSHTKEVGSIIKRYRHWQENR